jgi:hypothetical protein
MLRHAGAICATIAADRATRVGPSHEAVAMGQGAALATRQHNRL